jgi:malate dehydrogenase
MKRKVAIIGAGNVGASVATYLALKNICDIVVIDIMADMAKGKCLDLVQAGPVLGYDVNIEGTDDYAAVANADMVVITAGFPRKPGMTREDLINKNAEIVGPVSENIRKYAPNAMVLVVTNPLDIMTYHSWRVTGFPQNRVFGQAGVLDSIRFRTFIAWELGVSSNDVQAMVLGGHGDTMVPLPSYTTVSSVPITQLISAEKIKALSDRTRDGGGEIVKLLKTGSAFYAPAAATVQMVDAVLNDRKRMLPASAYVDGQYGLKGMYIGVPVILGANGVEKVVELKLTSDESAAMQKSGAVYKDMLSVLGY